MTKRERRERATWHLISLIYLISSMRIDGDFKNIKTNIYEWRFSLKLILIQEYIWEHEVSKQQQAEFFFQVAAGCHAFLVYLFLFLTHWENWEHERISKHTFAWLLLDIVEDQCEHLFLCTDWTLNSFQRLVHSSLTSVFFRMLYNQYLITETKAHLKSMMSTYNFLCFERHSV